MASRLVAPGFGKCVSWQNDQRLTDGVTSWSSAGITVRELCIMEIMDNLTDKHDWATKVFDEAITKKWREEALSSGADVTDKMMDWVIAELKDKAKEFKRDPVLLTMEREICLAKADNTVDGDIKNLLRSSIQSLEALKDWHPGSNEMVLDLVHPSLYPLIYGRTKVLPTETVPLHSCSKLIGQGETLQTAETMKALYQGRSESRPFFSCQFQWLPSNVSLSIVNGETKAEIISYVNNLHPLEHKNLYRVLEHLTEKSIPLWDKMFGAIDEPRPARISYDGNEPFSFPQGRERPESQRNPNESEDQAWDLDQEWEERTRVVIQPEPGEYLRFDRPKVDSRLAHSYGNHGGLQIIYKLANIHLTPNNPEYLGGSWHVEGMLNEHIVSTALYYYDCENISESRLSFRQSLADATEELIMIPPQNEYQGVEEVYGVEQEGAAIQDYGSILTKEDRLLVFPNVLQHRVAPFKLEDPSKPGHRKIVALFLVDPKLRILSTANIPPQQKSWWSPHLRTIDPLSQLPQELFDLVIESVDDFPISLSEAKEVRLQLMEERTNFVEAVNEKYEDIIFSFCEH